MKEKFVLFKDLGIIIVPDGYVHGTRLDSFRKKNWKRFYYYNENIMDANFPNPSRILKSGDKLWIRAFKQIVFGTTTSEERMAFLATRKAVFTSAQGASLILEQKRDQLPRGFYYVSFDKKKRLWKDADGYHGTPYVRRTLDGDCRFGLGNFESDGNDDYCLLCFCE